MSIFLDPIKYVADNASHVRIDHNAIDKYVHSFIQPTRVEHWINTCPFEYRMLRDTKAEINRRFIADSLAFCFWGYPDKWTIQYEGQKIDGWWALIASFQRAIENNIPILDANYLVNMTLSQTRTLFSGEPEIPLLRDRTHILNEIGSTLKNDYDGNFADYLSSAPRVATKLVLDIARVFPSFDDASIYKGQTIYFYKKAQLLVDELANEILDPATSHITGLDKLVGKADYKIPAIMRGLGILVFSPELSRKVDSRSILPRDSEEEVEIRACMLYANHLISRGLKDRGIDVSPMVLDGILWNLSQKKSSSDKPYHLTLTTDY